MCIIKNRSSKVIISSIYISIIQNKRIKNELELSLYSVSCQTSSYELRKNQLTAHNSWLAICDAV